MSTQENDNFDLAMRDVRGAFRLLYVYNRRVLDLMRYISARLGTQYGGGWASYGWASPGNGKGSLDNSGWDWLNMYFYEFRFKDIETDKKGYHFSILLQSDTGAWDGGCRALELEKYDSVDLSKTRLIFVLGNGNWDIDFSENNELKRDGKQEFKIDEPEGKSGYRLCKVFDISDFKDKKTANNSLNEYKNYLMGKGIAIELKGED